MSVLDPLYNLVARGVIVFHNLLAPIFGKHGFFSYAIAIALIVVIVRILIFPLFVRSVRAQRTMQMLQPRIKEIREKYKNDKQRMNQEVMKLQKEHGNPLLGCLPLLLQIPLFISLYHVFNAVRSHPNAGQGLPEYLAIQGNQRADRRLLRQGHSRPGELRAAHHTVVANSKAAEVAGLATAKFGGITLSSALTSSKKTLALFGADGTTVKIVAAIMIIFMAVTVYITQHQIMSRGGPVDPQQQKIQRIMLYGSPLLLAVFGLRFPIAVLVYWLVTNTWSMAQQVFILRKMPPVSAGTAASAATSSGPRPPPAKGQPARASPPPRPPKPPPKRVRSESPSRLGRSWRQRGRDAAGGTDRSPRAQTAHPAGEQRAGRRGATPRQFGRGRLRRTHCQQRGWPGPAPAAQQPACGEAQGQGTTKGRTAMSSTDLASEPDSNEEVSPDNGTSRPKSRAATDLVQEGDVAADYLEPLLDILDLDGDLDMDVEGERAVVAIVGKGLGALIGDKGETLEALQELTRLAVQRRDGRAQPADARHRRVPRQAAR